MNPAESPRSKDERRLERARKKRRAFERHTRSYFVTNGFLFLMWLTLAASLKIVFPWFLFPLFGWGIGYTIHALSYASWMRENREALNEARARLGLDSPEPAAIEDPWSRLDAACKSATSTAKRALEEARGELDVIPLVVRIEEGASRLEALIEEARESDATVAEVLPGGRVALEASLAEVETAMTETTHAPKLDALNQKRALLLERRAKLAGLRDEQERIRTLAEGYLIALENLRLDVVRIGARPADTRALESSIRRMNDEIDVLVKVRGELSDLSR
ncbi:MAG: Pr2TM family membrane protein [Myxococcales bacterium]|nr:Pr2TM family membrane protein [Myxococcales bacterium]